MSNAAAAAQTALSSSSVITLQRGAAPGADSIHVRSVSPAESALLAAKALKAHAPADDGATARNHSHDRATARLIDEREKPWRKATASPTASPQRSSPAETSSRWKQPSASDRLADYIPGKVDSLHRRRDRSNGSSVHTTPVLGPGALPKLKLPARDNLPRNYVHSPLTPAGMRTHTPGGTGILTPSSTGETTDYFGLGIVKPLTHTRSGAEASPLSPAAGGRHRSGEPHSLDSATQERRRSRGKEKRDKEKRSMLSKALEKANVAVKLDNDQDFAGALEAYIDACKLLEMVMERTSGTEDRDKLDAIRNTYSTRIEELSALQEPVEPLVPEKQLPPPPSRSNSDLASPRPNHSASAPQPAGLEAHTEDRTETARSLSNATANGRTRDSFLTNAIREVEGSGPTGFLGPLWERSRTPLGILDADATGSRDKLTGPDAPPPLSPNRTASPQPPPKDYMSAHAGAADVSTAKDGSVSWLNTIDESDTNSSVHSGKDPKERRRKNIANGVKSDTTDFDAAFDEAVEAAYEDSYSHQGDEEQQMMDDIAKDYMGQDYSSFNNKSKTSYPRESASSGYTRSTWQSSVGGPDRNTAATTLSTLAEDARSGSVTSHHQPQSSSSTVQTNDGAPSVDSNASGPIIDRRNQLPGADLKPLTVETNATPRANSIPPRQSRTSTASRGTTVTTGSKRDLEVTPWEAEDGEVTQWEAEDKVAEVTPWETQTVGGGKLGRMGSLRKEGWTPTSAGFSDSGNSIPGDVASPRSRHVLHKKSSLSLRESPHETDHFAPTPTSSTFSYGYTRRNDSTSQFSQRSGTIGSMSVPPLPEPTAQSGQAGGLYLFDTSLGRSIEPHPSSSPRTSKETTPPAPFEPCPDSFLLRPFWLLRCVSNTVTHPRGGYITTRLFMPHEAWLDRSAKLRNIEDKISACDTLSAALAPLENVDTCDADAVLAELQNFEETMERVQTLLAKKLGSEVGVGNATSMFKDAGSFSVSASAAASAADSAGSGADAAAVRESKTSATTSGGGAKFSWRKLRGKGSSLTTNPGSVAGASGGSATASGAAGGGASSAAAGGLLDNGHVSMSSVPMTSFHGVEKRTAHRREALRDAVFEGPHRDYMAAIAKLCVAAQVLDQVARQVEDPGLKHSSTTHVGLELSTRHAAEFFGFFICRFMLADIGALIDKHVKRSTEWVLA